MPTQPPPRASLCRCTHPLLSPPCTPTPSYWVSQTVSIGGNLSWSTTASVVASSPVLLRGIGRYAPSHRATLCGSVRCRGHTRHWAREAWVTLYKRHWRWCLAEKQGWWRGRAVALAGEWATTVGLRRTFHGQFDHHGYFRGVSTLKIYFLRLQIFDV
jgi:hypothetical protein